MMGTRVEQGKCPGCRLAFRWTGLPRLRDTYCPNCRGRLQRTSHLLEWNG